MELQANVKLGLDDVVVTYEGGEKLLCAERTANNSVFDTIREYGAAYIDLASDPIKYIIPDRWCDAKKTEPINAISIEEVKQYLAHHSAESSEFVLAVDRLDECILIRMGIKVIECIEVGAVEAPWEIRKDISISEGSFLRLVKFLSGLTR